MSRIRLLEDHEMETDIAQMVTDTMKMDTGDKTSLSLRVLAHRPDILRNFTDFYGKLQTEGLLDRKLVELVRLSIAQINQCPN